MSEQIWKRKKEIFAAAINAPQRERAIFLDENCGGDSQLRAEIEKLLEAYFTDDNFIEKPAFQIASAFDDAVNQAGKQFGNYRIIREIGRGGMGAVFLAERSDGEFEQKAALKIIRQNFAGAQIERHFRRERQILASLNHPNIAKLLDGGVSERGELFLVMEYVEGEPLLEFAENHKLNVEEKLRLFTKICRAVGFAHQNLIVHRDVKPSNVLVTKAGEPKLLDFGLAKITGDDFDPAQTATVFRAFTPSYASPEQIHGKNITTASDVYSLGVVLYELLTGERPFHFEGKSIEEILQTLDFTEPLRPSSVGNLKFDEPNSESRIPNLKSLKGDLDNITLKALRKEPERRYKSVEAFADDIERHLNGLPIRARANTIRYRAAKFFQRNKIAVSAAAFVVLALISGLAIALWQADVARRERDRAEKRFADVRELSNALLFKISPRIERLGGSIEAREILVNESLKYLDSLASESANDAALQSELASAYEKIGDLQGAPRQPNLSDFAGAAASYEKARAIRRKLLEANPNMAENLRLLAQNHARLGAVHYATKNLSGATIESETALEIYKNLIAAEPGRLDLQIESAAARLEYASIFFFNSQFDRFFPLLGETLEQLENLRHLHPESAEILRLVAKSRMLLGSGFSWDGKQPQAVAEMNKALEIGERLARENPNDNLIRQELLRIYWEAALINEQINDRQSREYFLKALEISEEAVRQDAADGQARENLAITFYHLGSISSNLKKNERAIEYLEKARGILIELERSEPKNQTYKMHLGRLYARYGFINANRNNWHFAVADYQKSADIFESVTRAETQNKTAWRYLAGQLTYIAEIQTNLMKSVAKKDQIAYRSAALENYRRALDIYLRLESENSLAEYDRKFVEQTRAAIKPLTEN